MPGTTSYPQAVDSGTIVTTRAVGDVISPDDNDNTGASVLAIQRFVGTFGSNDPATVVGRLGALESKGIVVYDEGTAITQVLKSLNFVGGEVTVSEPAADGVLTVTIPTVAPPISVSVDDEGVLLTSVLKALDFVGAGVTASLSGDGVVTVTVPGGGTGGAPDASATSKGILALAGDLGGSPTLPTVPTKVSKAGDTMTGDLLVTDHNVRGHLQANDGTQGWTGLVPSGAQINVKDGLIVGYVVSGAYTGNGPAPTTTTTTTMTNPQVPQGGANAFAAPLQEVPSAGPPSWEVLDSSGTQVGSTANPRGWSATYSTSTGLLTVTAPSSASVATNYKVKQFDTSQSPVSPHAAFFDVIPSGQSPVAPTQVQTQAQSSP